MTLVIILLLLALIFGGIGLFVEAVWWLLIIGAILLLASIISGMFSRGRAGV